MSTYPAKNISVIFWGTPDFALNVLKALYKDGYKIEAVVTNPDEPKGRNNVITPPPVKVFAEENKIRVFQPETLKDFDPGKLPEADIYIIAAYGKLIPRRIFEKPTFGALVVHPSLLPKWRGPSPVQFSILNGDDETGVSIMKMDELMDHGPVITREVVTRVDRKKFSSLNNELWEAAAKILLASLPGYLAGKITPEPQNDSLATFSKILKKDDGRIDWKKPAKELERMVRAFNPWPGTWTLWPGSGKIFRIKIDEADWTSEEPGEGSPGFTWQDGKHPLLVKTGKGSLIIEKLTLEGKKSLGAKELVHGRPQIIGSALV